MTMERHVLADHHREILTRQSAISAEVIAERNAWTAQTRGDLLRAGFRPSQIRAECLPAMVLPVWTPDGESPFAFARWDQARPTRNGRTNRYDAPRGATLRLDVPPRCRPGLRDPNLPLWITEGAKKADALASAGQIAVNVSGVWVWKTPAVQADFDSIVLRERRVIVAFDSDVLTKPPVRLAVIRLGRWLANRRSDVRIVDWTSVLEQAS
jgi:hypothetical protein